jgi:hypothetical protein
LTTVALGGPAVDYAQGNASTLISPAITSHPALASDQRAMRSGHLELGN